MDFIMTNFYPTLANVRLALLRLLTAVLAFGMLTQADARPPRPVQSVYIVGQENSVKLTASQYELALIQVLSEICPPMLTRDERTQFYEAYQSQLRKFFPEVENPNDTLRRFSTNPEYNTILQNIRTWTANYPTSENKAVCQDFAKKSQTF